VTTPATAPKKKTRKVSIPIYDHGAYSTFSMPKKPNAKSHPDTPSKSLNTLSFNGNSAFASQLEPNHEQTRDEQSNRQKFEEVTTISQFICVWRSSQSSSVHH
jgi:negative regulator of sigma E activity